MVLPKSLRISGYRCFDYFYKKGLVFHGKLISIRVVTPKPYLLKKHNHKSVQSSWKFAISISHKVSKKAVTRNKLRRLLHEHLTQKISKMNNKSSIWALITLKPSSAECESKEFLLKELDKLLFKSRVFQ